MEIIKFDCGLYPLSIYKVNFGISLSKKFIPDRVETLTFAVSILLLSTFVGFEPEVL